MCRLINLSAIFVIVISVLNLVYTIPLPQNGMFYYQTPMYYTPNQQSVHHAMLLHYGQPYQANGRRSNEGGLSAFASGDTIAAGTYLRDCKPIDSQAAANTRQIIHPDVQQNEPEINTADEDDENTVAVAEAFPGAEEPIESDGQNNDAEEGDVIEQQPNYNEVLPTQPNIGIKKKTPKYLPPPPAPIQPTEFFATESSTSYEIEASDTTIIPPQINNNSRRRRVRVELETPTENDADENDNNESDLSPYYPRQRPQQNGSGRPSHNNNNNNQQNPWPVNTFFPVNFGKTAGGAIAIANSYSTGKGGSATSHATAYGSPASRPRARLTNAQY